MELFNIPVHQDNSQRRPKSRPFLNSPRPFSEEDSRVTPTKPPPAVQELHRADSMRVQSSASPDFMLVGAHFTENRLVLEDRGGKIVHQLTDTDDSEANILHTDVNNEQEETEDLPESGSSTSVLEKTCSGVRPPPPTAMDDVRPALPATAEEDHIQTITEDVDS